MTSRFDPDFDRECRKALRKAIGEQSKVLDAIRRADWLIRQEPHFVERVFQQADRLSLESEQGAPHSQSQ